MLSFLFLILRGLAIALEAPTLFSRLLAGAVTMIFFTYAFVNMGMVSGILPGGGRAAALYQLWRHGHGDAGLGAGDFDVDFQLQTPGAVVSEAVEPGAVPVPFAVTLIGVGNMGGGMAQRLCSLGWAPAVHDLDRSKVAGFDAFWGSSPRRYCASSF